MDVERMHTLSRSLPVQGRSLDMQSWGACLALHCCALTDRIPIFASSETAGEVAREYLGLTQLEADQLFHLGNWPQTLQAVYRAAALADDQPTLVRVAREAIRWLIETHQLERMTAAPLAGVAL
jgi:hypothetical protein